jgi:drug/metabolite transporter (DMT)-like permease
MFLPFWLALEAKGFVNTPFHWEAFRAILLLSFFASSLAFIFFTYSVRHLGINRANTFVYLIPVFTAIFSRIILDEALTFRKAVGVLIVISGLFLATIRKKS